MVDIDSDSPSKVDHDSLEENLSGLDALEMVTAPTRNRLAGLWATTWPKLAAIVLGLAAWQFVVWMKWRPDYVLPGPGPVFARLRDDLTGGTLPEAILTTLRRAASGFALAIVIGSALGIAVVRIRGLRAAVGSLISGLQTMPSIAWFPLAILLFPLSEKAILFVVVLGAAPGIAIGLISGIDHIPPLLLRTGRVLGARGLAAYRYVILPASLPSYVAGLKQGWAFAWRSLMAGELLVNIANRPSIGVELQTARDFQDAEGLLATMVVILVIGIAVDSLLFGTVERRIRQRRGLVEAGN